MSIKINHSIRQRKIRKDSKERRRIRRDRGKERGREMGRKRNTNKKDWIKGRY